MTKTTPGLSAELKQRMSELARTAGTSVHGLMAEASAEKAAELELPAALHAEADARF